MSRRRRSGRLGPAGLASARGRTVRAGRRGESVSGGMGWKRVTQSRFRGGEWGVCACTCARERGCNVRPLAHPRLIDKSPTDSAGAGVGGVCGHGACQDAVRTRRRSSSCSLLPSRHPFGFIGTACGRLVLERSVPPSGHHTTPPLPSDSLSASPRVAVVGTRRLVACRCALGTVVVHACPFPLPPPNFACEPQLLHPPPVRLTLEHTLAGHRPRASAFS